MPRLRNARQEAFAQARAAGQTIDAAYVEAGYKPNRSNASQLNAKQHVQDRIGELQDRAAERAEITGAQVLTEIARVGLSDIRKLFDQDGRLIPIQDLPDDIAAAVASVEVITTNRPGVGGEKGEVEYTSKIKLWDKNSALEKLAKHFRLYEDKDAGKTDPVAALLAAVMGSARPLPVASEREA